ncbi:MAG: GNAT family N-acetyltransferase [Lachnospiraceae bacterium]|nr:GNAT family N-acetyltransferase [Lachnospiraceae bacterium]
MEIRYLHPSDDRKAISKIYERSWKYAYRDIIPQEFLDSIPEGQWTKKLDNPEWSTMVCVENGEYVGTSSFCKSRFEQFPESGEVISIYFLPEYMGKGYGKKLLEAVLKELKQRGFTEVFLWVLEDNQRARAFYERFGFECTDDYLEDCIGGKKLREVRYVCTISR